VGKRGRRRGAEALEAPESRYESPEGDALVLRGAMTPATRAEYGRVRAGGLDREDAWQRSVEFLFERLAVRWTVEGVAYERQKEILARYRMATADERAAVRDALREHLAAHFPDVEAP
jgi:hypothetical protein